MASDVAQHELVTSSLPADAPLTNGNHDQTMLDDDSQNAEAFEENAAISKTETNLDISSVAPADSQPGGPTPVEDVAPGIAPVADFIPKEAPTSHPTPPPDEPLLTSEANIDTDKAATVDAPPKEPTPVPEPEKEPAPAPVPASNEPSLVRPREEDGDGEEDAERAAKRSRTEDVPMEDAPAAESLLVVAKEDEPAAESSALPSGAEASAVAKAETTDDLPMTSPPTEAPETASAPQQSDAPLTNGDTVAPATSETSAADAKPSEDEVKPSVESEPKSSTETLAAPAAKSYQYAKEPMTQPQMRFLVEKMKNLKKTKNSHFFNSPVDPVALNIPTYPEIIKNPMDLGTMDQKLKGGQYQSVQAFADDFELILSNTMKFNGPQHPVTQAGMSMEAYFRRMMETVPSSDYQAKSQAKKVSPKPPAPVRRESRSATVTSTPVAPPPAPPAPPAAAASEPFALQPDGTPQIRRESTTNRPARTIKPPPARELSYAKPKRKEHQVELKFVEWVLNQIKGPKYSTVNHVFQSPVDPVALNIPHYRQIVKHPMDMSTMSQKLKQGQYGRASEFKKDFDLMIQNCLAFNPQGNPVRDLGIQFQREFEALWRQKDQWEKKRKAEAARANSASAEEESAEEEEEEEEEEQAPANSAATIAALQKQLAEMQNALAGLGQAPQPKAKKAKAPKATSKKGGASAPKAAKAATTKSKPKKEKQVTYEEKQEISEAVTNMDGPQVEELTRIITTNCKKYADQEEMELEIDDLPNNVQVLLLSYVRSIFGNPNKRARQPSPDDIANADDDDFELPARGARGGRGGGGGAKRKKHKPMGKQEQQAAINNIQKQLAQFKEPGASGSISPTNSYPAQDANTSGDDESEESEEE